MNHSSQCDSRSWWGLFAQIGPGIAIAATGVGAADLVASTVAGARYGTTLVWAIVLGALLKFALNEGVARWHLATGKSVLQGWSIHLGKPALVIFLGYLLAWSIIVTGGLIVASGLAAHSVCPLFSRQVWGIVQALIAVICVWFGSYDRFEKLMKAMIAVMCLTILGCAIATAMSAESPFALPSMPSGSLPLTLSLAGGVGGSVTMMVYGYWIEQKDWTTTSSLRVVRFDLGIAYAMTALLAIGAMLLASEVLLPQGITVEGSQGLIQMASMLRGTLGVAGEWIFLVGFWGAAFSSLVGVLQGVPYLFADWVHCWRRSGSDSAEAIESGFNYNTAAGTTPYRVFLLYMALPSMLLLFYDKPIWIMVLYAAVSSLFLPILTTALLIMNNRADWVGRDHRNGLVNNVGLLMAMGLFVYLTVNVIMERFGGS